MGMIQTSHAEMEALFEKMMPHFLDYLKAHGTPVDRIELATTLHGITSLPARMDTGGVVKTVLAPLHLLSDVAEDAAQECRDATQDCREATADSRQATADCRDATAKATDATAKAKEATDATLAARDAIEANERTRQDNEAVRQANEQARKNAETQRGTAEQQRINQESSRQSAEQARKDAEAARVTEHNALKEASQTATQEAIQAKEGCEDATEKATQATADLTQIKAEVDASKKAAEKATSDTLAAKEAIELHEAERQANEVVRQTKETERQSAEQARKDAEAARVTEHEALKDASEKATAGAVKAKEDADNAREGLEQIKEATEDATSKANTAATETLAAKNLIESKEAERQAAELMRQQNEQARQTAEQERSEALDTHLEQCTGKVDKLITDTNATVSGVISSMESDIDTAKDTLISKVNSAVEKAQSDIATEVTKAQNATKAANNAATSANTQAGRAKAHADNPPKIGENGNWHVYSENVGGYVDSGIMAKVETGDWATKQWVGQQGFLTSHQDLSALATKTALADLSGKLDDFLTGTDTDSVINKWKELEAFLAGYSETNTLAGLLSGKADANHTHDYSGVYAAKSHNHDTVYAKIADIPSLNGYATQTWVNQQGFLKSHQSLADYLKKTDAASLYQPKGNYLTSHQSLDHINNLGSLTAVTGSTVMPSGLRLYSVYNNGYPVTYGNLLRIGGSGSGELLCGWTGDSSLGRILYRSKRDVASQAWSAWGTVAYTSDLAWSNISGKPSTYAPSAHTHTVANVTGLQDALNGKAASSHTHTIANVTGLQDALDGKAASHSHPYLPTSGGSMTGNITFGNHNQGVAWARVTDGASILFDCSTDATDNYLTFHVTDDENVNFKWTKNVAGTLLTLGTWKREGIRLGVGNFIGNLTGNADSASNAAKLEGKAASAFALASHTHNYAAANHTHDYSGSFAAKSHTHTIANVTGLQDALNGKAASNHTHSYAAANHTHDYSGSFAPKGFSDFYEGANTVTTLASVPVTKRTVVATISANASFSLAATPSDGREVHIIVKNSGSADATVAIPSAYIISGGEDTLIVPAGGYAEINVLSAGSKLYVRMAT